MQKIYSKIIRISGDVITVEAEDVAYMSLAQVMSERSSSLAQVIRLDGKKVSLQVFSGSRGISTGDKVRFADDFHNITYWERQAALSSTPNDPWTNTNVPVDTDWHTFRIYRAGSNLAGFQIDGNPVETTGATVPTIFLPAGVNPR